MHFITFIPNQVKLCEISSHVNNFSLDVDQETRHESCVSWSELSSHAVRAQTHWQTCVSHSSHRLLFLFCLFAGLIVQPLILSLLHPLLIRLLPMGAITADSDECVCVCVWERERCSLLLCGSILASSGSGFKGKKLHLLLNDSSKRPHCWSVDTQTERRADRQVDSLWCRQVGRR